MLRATLSIAEVLEKILLIFVEVYIVYGVHLVLLVVVLCINQHSTEGRVIIQLLERVSHESSRYELGIPRVSESNRCHIGRQGCLGKDYFRTTVFFPANFVTLLAVI